MANEEADAKMPCGFDRSGVRGAEKKRKEDGSILVTYVNEGGRTFGVFTPNRRMRHESARGPDRIAARGRGDISAIQQVGSKQ